MNIVTPSDGVAWVTGASSGIGREVAAQLARAGWIVAISARREEELASLAALHPGKMLVVPLDITDQPAVAAAVARIEAESGRKIARAVLNAGTYIRDTAPDFDVQKFKTQLDVNLLGTANCLAAIMPQMLAAGRGQIGIVGSLAGLSGLPGAVTYSSTKAALLAMAQSLKFDFVRAGLAISYIAPGFVKTPLTEKNQFPMPFLMDVEDAAAAILRGLNGNKFLIAFPGKLAWPLRFMRILPAPVFTALVSRATKW
jgi:NADP-dependent 3-hydroxy acid dehydrogenase YdfG